MISSLVLIGAIAAQDGTRLEKFVFVSEKPAKSVSVAGTFNGWNKDANPMTLDADGRTFTTSIRVPFGKLQYKFVRDGEEWITDPRAEKNENDGNGNINSIRFIVPPDYEIPAKKGDGIIALSLTKFLNEVPYLNYDKGTVRFSLTCRPGDVQRVEAVLNGKVVPMQFESSDELVARYSIKSAWDRKSDLRYEFRLIDGEKTHVLGGNGLLKAKDFRPFETPKWVEGTVFYQIFPDRFENGSAKNDPPNTEKWGAKPTYYNRFGGDIAGIQKRFAHIANLGVNAVYFNPVFKSPSNHRYDAEDFRQIAPDFGTNEEYLALAKRMKQSNVRLVMDFVFNHSATTFPPFADIVKNGESSQYKNWYFIKSYPVQVKTPPTYEAWFGFPSMPKMNVLNPEVEKYFFDTYDFWKNSAGVSGIRLDVANEVDMRFWRKLRLHAKAKDPDLWIVGEVWGDGSPWLKGDQWDSVMNYQFRDACLGFIAEGRTTSTQFWNRLYSVHTSYAPQVSRNMMNLLGSHDTPRFKTLCGGSQALANLGAIVQFTWIGAPSVYYGDELGMEGGADPDNRRCMEWDKVAGNQTLSLYQKLIRVRKNSPALSEGEPILISANDADRTVAYERRGDSESVVVAINRSADPKSVFVTVPKNRQGNYLDILTGKTLRLSDRPTLLVLGGTSGSILVPAKSNYLSNTRAPKAVAVNAPQRTTQSRVKSNRSLSK